MATRMSKARKPAVRQGGSRVQLYVRSQDLKEIDEAAAAVDQSRSEFMVSAALDRARAGSTAESLSAEQRNLMTRALHEFLATYNPLKRGE